MKLLGQTSRDNAYPFSGRTDRIQYPFVYTLRGLINASTKATGGYFAPYLDQWPGGVINPYISPLRRHNFGYIENISVFASNQAGTVFNDVEKYRMMFKIDRDGEPVPAKFLEPSSVIEQLIYHRAIMFPPGNIIKFFIPFKHGDIFRIDVWNTNTVACEYLIMLKGNYYR